MDEVTEDVARLRLKGVNAYLDTSDGVTLVDTGTPWDAGTIRGALEQTDLTLRDVDRVLITHYDVDHVGGLHALAPDLDATAYMMEPDRSYLTGDGKPGLRNHKALFHRLARLIVKKPGIDIESVEDGDAVGAFEAIHTPGHTPGHTVFLDRGRGVCYLGDLVMESDGAFKIPNRFLNYSTKQVRDSVMELAGEAEFDVGCMGHGDPVGVDAGGKLGILAGR